MDIVRGATRVVTQTANATTAAAGAVSGAAINGIIGGVQGSVAGIRNGLSAGSHSTPAALLTLGAIGATGLVEWPLLLTVGGTALLVRQFNKPGGETQATESGSTTPPTKTSRKATPSRAKANRSARPARAAARRSS
jgi:hypothetical protein